MKSSIGKKIDPQIDFCRCLVINQGIIKLVLWWIIINSIKRLGSNLNKMRTVILLQYYTQRKLGSLGFKDKMSFHLNLHLYLALLKRDREVLLSMIKTHVVNYHVMRV